MGTMSISKKHNLSHKKAKEAAQQVANDLQQRFDLAYVWRGDRIEFERPGLRGEMHVGKDEVRLDCQLGFLLSALKSAIEKEVHKEFDKRFAKVKT
jgi:putative polyhydroxyalkanoate system protein